MVRRVYGGKVDHVEFFRNIYGNFMMSGLDADNIPLLADLICEYAGRKDIPTIVLTGHRELMTELLMRQNCGKVDNMIVSDPNHRNYHPMYGMSNQQILRIIRMAGERIGCGMLMDQVLLYAASLLDIVATKYPVSLPAMATLLQEDDDFIAAFAMDMRLSNITADNILGNHEAGIMLRRIIEKLEEEFEMVYQPGNDTKYTFLSGVQKNVSVMVYSQNAGDQDLMNLYLKEELYAVLKSIPRIRIILDNVAFVDESDELLTYITQMKRQGKIELIAVSGNVKRMFFENLPDFENICMFLHENTVITEDISKALFGVYPYYYPVPVAGKPPAFLFTLKKDMHWQVNTEERLRVRAEDLYGVSTLFSKAVEHIAVKTTANANVYLIPKNVFLSMLQNYNVINEQEVRKT
jgi:hypothetical protein